MKKCFLQIMSRLPLIKPNTKLLISLVLLSISFIGLLIRPNNIDSQIILLAMSISTTGDFFMNYTLVEKRPHSFLYAGASCFMLAHLVYAIAYITMIKQNSFSYFNIGIMIAILVIVAIISMIIGALIGRQKRISKIMAIIFGIYVIFVSFNFLTISSYSYSAHSFCFIGAFSFLISDLIIGIENLFKIKSDILRKLVWIFYPLGQVIIILCR